MSLPLLPVWMNVSSLTPWLSNFHTVRFSVSSGCFLFLNCYSSFGCARRHIVTTYVSILAGSLMYLLLWHYQTVLITEALEYSFISGIVIPPALFFFLKYSCSYSGLFMVPYKFLKCLFYICEICHGYFNRDCIEFINRFGQYGHFDGVNSPNPWAWYMLPFVCVLSDCCS